MLFSRILYFCLVLALSMIPVLGVAQPFGYLQGIVQDNHGEPVEFVNIGVLNDPDFGTTTNSNGFFLLRIPAKKQLHIAFTFVGYKPVKHTITINTNDTVNWHITINKEASTLPLVTVKSEHTDKPSTFTIKPEDVEYIPLPGGSFESILKTIGLGVSTAGGELSSQYSVRGGNYDENLVYVNDFEIYRPFLVRSGQQEGLSFINPDMVRKVEFSSGGFEARFGDKLSSVLDVHYKKPDSLRASVGLSLLGASAHLEGRTSDLRLSYLLGVRQKSNRYLLSSLNTKGDYNPSFTDVQVLVNYAVDENWEFEFIGNLAHNKYQFEPRSSVTSIGTVDNVKELEVFFEGQESDAFQSMMGGLSATYVTDSNRLRLKWLASVFRTTESETFDIIGDYFLYQVESDLGSKEFGERKFGLGYGTFHDYARNYLTAQVANLSHKGYWLGKKQFIEWGAGLQYEVINDELNEWERIDSALYTLPYSTSEVLVWDVLKTKIDLASGRLTGYLQDTWILSADSTLDMNLTAGVRSQYWNLNKEWLISPRVQFSMKPGWENPVIFKAAAGLYQQAPFYRELRNNKGVINESLKAQKSWQVVLGTDYIFKAWQREFRLISEIYYKQLWDLVPYDVEDVKIRYYGENLARGYATGIDMRLHGQFVKDAESWISVSVMKTQEDIEGDTYLDEDSNLVDIGYLNRPTDQRVNVGILFQDYLPRNENFKMHLNLLFGTGLPFSAPRSVRFRNAFRIPPYRRVDIGFSALLFDGKKELREKSIFRHFRSLWASLEVFNLLQIENTVSHIWVKDNTNTYYPFENYLTSRRINLRIVAKL